MLHHILAILHTKRDKQSFEDASHLCGNTTCTVVGHVIWESKLLNQRRKGCNVILRCTCRVDCQDWVDACIHDPKCVSIVRVFNADGSNITEEQYRMNPSKFVRPIHPLDLQELTSKLFKSLEEPMHVGSQRSYPSTTSSSVSEADDAEPAGPLGLPTSSASIIIVD